MKRIIFFLFIFIAVACVPQKSPPRENSPLTQAGGNSIVCSEGFAGELLPSGAIKIRCTTPEPEPSPTETATNTAVPPATNTATAIPPTDTPAPTNTATAVPPSTPTVTTTPLPGPIAPFPLAPLCPDTGTAHDTSEFHTLWNGEDGCHYDHEHGVDPFVPEVVSAFPGLDLFSLLGGVEVGHSNPSSPAENVHKHGGMKWFWTVDGPSGCNPRNSATIGVDAAAIQYHGFGDYEIELEARIHSAAGLLRQCRPDDPADFGYIFVIQHLDYGQRTAPYQGVILPYPDTPNPAYPTGNAPYITIECYGGASIPCNKYATLAALIASGNTGSSWASEANHGFGSGLFGLLFSAADVYKALDATDLEYPFTFGWFCGGSAYNPAGCRFNNTQTFVNEAFGRIPAAWDNLPNFDMDPEVGRITADSFVTRFGDLNLSCTESGIDCHRIKLVRAFVGSYGAFLISDKFDLHIPAMEAERDIYFCAGVVCEPGDAGAVPSGWVGPEN